MVVVVVHHSIPMLIERLKPDDRLLPARSACKTLKGLDGTHLRYLIKGRVDTCRPGGRKGIRS